MRRNAFTLIEMMVVVALLGILAGATVWWLAGDAERATRADVIGQITHADRMTRLAAQRLGVSCMLRFDLDEQRLWRVTGDETDLQTRSHSFKIPDGYRVERLLLPSAAAGIGDMRPNAAESRFHGGQVEIAYSTEGRSVSYALLLTKDRAGDINSEDDFPDVDGWLVISGLTGQVVMVHDEDEADRVFATLAGWSYAH